MSCCRILLLMSLAAGVAAMGASRALNRTSSTGLGGKCSSGTSCLKLDLLRLVSRLGNNTRISLGAGIALVGTERTAQIAMKLYPLALSSEPLEPFITDLLAEYLGSLNLTLQVRESNLLQQFKQFGQQLWSLTTQNSSTYMGRAKHKSGWYAIGTVAAVGFALLAALCGKALMASMLALALSALVALRAAGPGFGAAAAFASPTGRVTQYEIISKPIAYATAPAAHIYDHEHHHSTVAHTGPTYTYSKRELDGSKDE